MNNSCKYSRNGKQKRKIFLDRRKVVQILLFNILRTALYQMEDGPGMQSKAGLHKKEKHF